MMIKEIRSLLLDPYLLRTISKGIIQKFQLGSYEQRLRIGAMDRPHYGYLVYQAASLAKKLGYPSISVLEFGVAGGNGLVNLEEHARQVENIFPVKIEIYGFDLGEGLPAPQDYRDVPYAFQTGFYKMDVPRLKAKLKTARLVLGDIHQTGASFFDTNHPAPIGAVFYDMDFYSSTVAALRMLAAPSIHYLPRVFTYFDDTVGSDVQLYNDYTGERRAIHEFNETHSDVKLTLPYYLLAKRIVEPWYHRIWIAHFFQHPDYSRFIGEEVSHSLKS